MMQKATRTIHINAPADQVFSYIDEPTNQPDFWPSLMEVTDVEQLPDGRHRSRWAYKMAGVRLEGTSEDIERVPNQRLVSKTKGGADSTQAWTFQPEDRGTRVTFEIEYTVPIPVLGKLAESVIVKMNDKEGDLLMENLKTMMEA